MNPIALNDQNWTSPEDFYSALLPALNAPDWHGHSLDALYDSLSGGINEIEPPFKMIIQNNRAHSADIASDQIWTLVRLRLRATSDISVRVGAARRSNVIGLPRWRRRLPQQRQHFRNDGAAPLEIWVELIPRRYVLQPGEEMTITADAPPSNEGFTVNAYEGGLQVYAACDIDPIVQISGKPATSSEEE